MAGEFAGENFHSTGGAKATTLIGMFENKDTGAESKTAVGDENIWWENRPGSIYASTHPTEVTSSYNMTSSVPNATVPDAFPWAIAFGSTSAFLCTTGMVSNVILLLMMLSKDLRRTSHGVCLAAISVMNTALLAIRLLRTWATLKNASTSGERIQASLEGIAQVLGEEDSVAPCILIAIEQCLQASEAWTTGLLAIDRTLFLCFPVHRMKLCTAKRTLLGVAVIVGVCLAVYLPPITLTLVQHYQDEAKVLPDSLPPLLSAVCAAVTKWYHDHIYQNVGFAVLAPILLVFVCSCILMVEIRSRTRKARAVIISHDFVEQTIRRMVQQNKLTASMLGVLLHFIVSLLPQSILAIVQMEGHETQNSSRVDKPTTEEVEGTFVEIIVREFSELLTTAHYSDMLWLLLASNKSLRRLLYQVMCSRRVNLNADLSRSNTRHREAVRKRLDDFTKTTSGGVKAVKLGWGKWKTSRLPAPVVTEASRYMPKTGLLKDPNLKIGYEVTGHDDVSRSSSQASTDTVLREAVLILNSLNLPEDRKMNIRDW